MFRVLLTRTSASNASELVPDADGGGGVGKINSAFSPLYCERTRPPFDSINPGKSRVARSGCRIGAIEKASKCLSENKLFGIEVACCRLGYYSIQLQDQMPSRMTKSGLFPTIALMAAKCWSLTLTLGLLSNKTNRAEWGAPSDLSECESEIILHIRGSSRSAICSYGGRGRNRRFGVW